MERMTEKELNQATIVSVLSTTSIDRERRKWIDDEWLSKVIYQIDRLPLIWKTNET